MTSQDTKLRHRQARASVIIPAHNEAQVIRRCLRALLKEAAPGEFDIIVVCNGCSDDTEIVARESGPEVRVFSIDKASKTAALNYGDRMARTFPRVYLDSDLEVDGSAVRALIDALQDGRRLAAVGFMDVSLADRSWRIRRFYQLWMLHPYIRQGKFGGVYALNQAGWLRRGPYPSVVADDTFVRNCFTSGECVSVPACRFQVFPPRTLRDIFRIRSRAYLGNLQLYDRVGKHNPDSQGGSVEWLRRVACLPNTWLWLPIYVVVNLLAKARAHQLYRRDQFDWLRDESSRQTEQVLPSL